MRLPSQITAAALATLVISFVVMCSALDCWTLTSDQLEPVVVFVTAASNFGFGLLLWWVNKDNPNPDAPVEKPE